MDECIDGRRRLELNWMQANSICICIPHSHSAHLNYFPPFIFLFISPLNFSSQFLLPTRWKHISRQIPPYLNPFIKCSVRPQKCFFLHQLHTPTSFKHILNNKSTTQNLHMLIFNYMLHIYYLFFYHHVPPLPFFISISYLELNFSLSPSMDLTL